MTRPLSALPHRVSPCRWGLSSPRPLALLLLFIWPAGAEAQFPIRLGAEFAPRTP